VFKDFYEVGRVRDRNTGRRCSESFGYSSTATGIRTPTLKTLSLQAGERRFLVKRVAFAAGGASRRRRFWEGTAVRIHAPNVSGLLPAAREALASSRSWPEILHFHRLKDKSGGRWRLGVKESIGASPSWSPWISWESSDTQIVDAFNQVVLPSGIQCFAEAWKLSSSRRSWMDNSFYSSILMVWRPAGDLLPLEFESDGLRGTTINISVVSDGNANDLFLFPISGSLMELPAHESQAQLSVVNISGLQEDPAT